MRSFVRTFVAAQPAFLRFYARGGERAAEWKYDRRADVPERAILALWRADGMTDHHVRKEVSGYVERLTLSILGNSSMGKIPTRACGSLSVD